MHIKFEDSYNYFDRIRAVKDKNKNGFEMPPLIFFYLFNFKGKDCNQKE